MRRHRAATLAHTVGANPSLSKKGPRSANPTESAIPTFQSSMATATPLSR